MFPGDFFLPICPVCPPFWSSAFAFFFLPKENDHEFHYMGGYGLNKELTNKLIRKAHIKIENKINWTARHSPQTPKKHLDSLQKQMYQFVQEVGTCILWL